uniref:EF-hand domain-containing protein n=1 Tax=Arion vulgaris TaxID=1028688 RepID=A0A0B7A639_9EUPU
MAEKVMINRSLSNNGKDEAMSIFSKYQSNHARRLKKAEAINMLMTEFNLTEIDAQIIFQAFDKDNNDVMSLWEFRQFYQTVGFNAHNVIDLFRKLEEDATGTVNIEKTFDALRNIETGKGKLTDDEIEMLLKATAGESKTIDLHKFLNLMCRLKVYKGSQ